MHSLVRTVFGRLHTLDPEVEEKKLLALDETQGPEIGIPDPSTSDTPPTDTTSAEVNVPQPAEEERTAVPETSGVTARAQCTFVFGFNLQNRSYNPL